MTNSDDRDTKMLRPDAKWFEPPAPKNVIFSGARRFTRPLARDDNGRPLRCEHCDERSDDVAWSASCTAYYWNGEGEDPNRDQALCDACDTDHRAYWTERWQEVNHGRL
jgi:hypothetical protein